MDQTPYNELINSLQDGILIVDSVGKILLANRAAAKILGYETAEELTGKTVDSLYANPEDHDSLLSILGHKGFCEKGLFDWKQKNGATFFAEVSAQPIYDQERHIGGIQAVFRDITGRLKQQIDQQESLMAAASTGVDESQVLDLLQVYKTNPMSLILQGLAHNLNTPLGAIRGRAELLQHQIKKSHAEADLESLKVLQGKIDKGLAEMIGQVDKVSELIRGFATKIANEMYPSEVDINLNDLILAELSFLDSSLYFKHKIQKNISLDPDLPILHGLYRPISQAIHNIIIHSMKATAELPDKILTINTRQTPVHLVVEISDNRKIRKNEAEYLSKPHFESMYMGIPDEANFSAHDIDVALAAKCLTDASIGFQFFPNNEAKFIIQIQK